MCLLTGCTVLLSWKFNKFDALFWFLKYLSGLSVKRIWYELMWLWKKSDSWLAKGNVTEKYKRLRIIPEITVAAHWKTKYICAQNLHLTWLCSVSGFTNISISPRTNPLICLPNLTVESYFHPSWWLVLYAQQSLLKEQKNTI